MTKKKYVSKVKVRYAETDQMGVVHHANYPIYLELARTEWLKNLGFSYKKMEEDGIILPVYSLSVNYKQTAMYDDELYIETALKTISGARIEFVYKIENTNKKLVAEASTILVFVNKISRRPTRCPKAILEVLS